MNKKQLTGLMSSFLLSCFMLGCSSDDFKDVDGKAPTIDLVTDHIQSEVGRAFKISGTITDNDGIRSIRLENEQLNLDKTINLSDIYEKTLTSYDLDYSFKTPATLTGDNFAIRVTVTDLGGRTIESTILLTMDGDFTNPVFITVPDANITVLIKDQTKLNLRFSVQDDKALDHISVSIPSLNYTKTIAVTGKTYNYSDVVTMPSSVGTYAMTISAVDKFKLTTTQNCTINVSEMPDFDKMYLTDVSDAALLNSDVFGIPSIIDHTGAYTYTARYYSEAAGTKIRFIPQKTDFSPICFGIDPDNTSLLTDDPDVSQPIVLPTGKEYYEITFNVKTGKYSYKTYVPENPLPQAIGSDYLLDPAQPQYVIPFQIGLVGKGLPGNDTWSPSNITPLIQDKDNPYLFSTTMSLTAGTKMEFIIHNKHDWGWWDYCFWRFDSKTDIEKCVWKGGDNASVTIKTTGKYMFKFDAHLKRARFYPIN